MLFCNLALRIIDQNSSKMSFAERLKIARQKKGLTKSELARQAQISYPQLVKYELGQVKPNLLVIEKLVPILEVGYDFLCGGVNEEEIDAEVESLMSDYEQMDVLDKVKCREILRIFFQHRRTARNFSVAS